MDGTSEDPSFWGDIRRDGRFYRHKSSGLAVTGLPVFYLPPLGGSFVRDLSVISRGVKSEKDPSFLDTGREGIVGNTGPR